MELSRKERGLVTPFDGISLAIFSIGGKKKLSASLMLEGEGQYYNASYGMARYLKQYFHNPLF